MARYLLAATPLAGHVFPMLRIGAGLRRRGHDVTLLTGADYHGHVRRAGLRTATLPPDAHIHPSSSARPSRLPPMIRRYLLGRAALRSVFLAPLTAQHQALRAVLQRERVDAVLVDLAFTGALPLLLAKGPRPPVLVCGVSPLTLSSIDTPPFGTGWPPKPNVNYASMTRFVHRVMFATTRRLLDRALHEVDAGPSPLFLTDWPRLADRVLQLTVPSFEYPRRDLPATVTFTGPIFPEWPAGSVFPPWWNQLKTARTIIHVTQGTWDNTDLDQLVGPTLRGLATRDDLLVIATTGGGPIRSPQGVLRWSLPRVSNRCPCSQCSCLSAAIESLAQKQFR